MSRQHNPKILLLGCNGQIGRSLCDAMHDVIAPDYRNSTQGVDLRDTHGLMATIDKLRPKIIINAAAYTNVDLAEANEAEVFSTNFKGVQALAQAAKESGWGTSRFALEGNALFGQWTWSGEGLKPKDAEKDEGHKVMKFNVLQASVRAYQRNLNTHSSYREFRNARAKLRDEGLELDSITLSEHLDKYAETGKKYVDTLKKIISQNNLKDFDDAKLLPSSKKLESLI